MDKVNGVVEAVGDKFNGSLKINGVWYSFKKGVSNSAKKGDNVSLTLGEWEFKGKKGLNIIAVEMLQVPTEVATQTAVEAVSNGAKVLHVGRDYDAENRGKVRHGLMVSLLPLVATDTITLDKAKEIVNEVLEYVMGGK